MRQRGPEDLRRLLSDWPVQRPDDWLELVNRPLAGEDLERMRSSLSRGRPFGEDGWQARTVRRLHLEHTVRREGRPAGRDKRHAIQAN